MTDTFQVCVHQPGRRIRSVETDKLEPMPAKVTNWKASGDLFVWVIGGLMLSQPLQGMYKGSEPIRLQHVLWMVRSRSKICPKFLKFPNFPNLVQSSSIVFIEILLIFDNLSYFGVFLEKKKT